MAAIFSKVESEAISRTGGWSRGVEGVRSREKLQISHSTEWEPLRKERMAHGTSLAVQWLRLCTSNAGGTGNWSGN